MRFRRLILFTLVGVSLATGCGKSPAEKDFFKMVERTKREYKAQRIRSAVMPFFQVNSGGKANVPNEISSLPLFAADRSVIDLSKLGEESGHPKGLAFITGSGFGHWGLVICPFEDGENVARSLHGNIIPWEDGVYFFLER